MRTMMLLVSVCMVAFADGQQAPPFTLKNLTGDTVSLASCAGRVVVLDFWVLWCETCRAELPKIERLHAKYAEKNVAVLGIHLHEKNTKRIGKFVKKAGITYPVLVDPDERVADLYDVSVPPAVVVIDTAGTIVRTFRELDGKAMRDITTLLDSLTAK
jgi:peroxiredoxin